ncbi:cystatin-like fold lipoprotein [Bacillus safensis]|uniref:cystatin-like fold lipoprotein n=1 Tax=Bacillus safensis TaxID=561879 RepID=UPI0010718F0D|nr:cystatin-like fold lipoprotein [Bacillus stratosphericus]
MIKKLVLSFALLAAITGLAGCGSTKAKYDEAIDQVISLENKSIQRPGVKKDIDELDRKNAEIRVYQDGKYISLDYPIRVGDAIRVTYERQDNGKYEQSSEDDDDLGKPEYTENVKK